MARATNVSDIVDGEVELVATGFVFTEGPIWHPDGFLIFSDPGGNRQYRVTPGEVPTLIREGESPDGATLDIDGRLVTCDQAGRKVVVVDIESGDIEVLVDSYQGKKMNMCNDVVGKSDGTLYFSDPGGATDRRSERNRHECSLQADAGRRANDDCRRRCLSERHRLLPR